MGKISPVSAKYIINATIEIDGVVDRPDIIGAVFGQTEGLLGADLELRELQRSGRIGRIEVDTETRGGKTAGKITMPSSLDKAETAIVAAALEVIQRIGPCTAKASVENIEDVRVNKRTYVVSRAKELLRNLMDKMMPDSQELAEEVAQAVRVMEIQEYGADRLPAGPAVSESDEVIVTEGRADVVNLLKYGFKNVIGMNGTSVPKTISELSKKKVITAFLDGDRGGDLILKELLNVAEIDYATRAPDGKEVEELTKKEIHKALRARVVPEQLKIEKHAYEGGDRQKPGVQGNNHDYVRRNNAQQFSRRHVQRESRSEAKYDSHSRMRPQRQQQRQLSQNEKSIFKEISGALIGTRGAYLFDEKLNVLGKVPLTELPSMLQSLKNVYAVVLDGTVDAELVKTAEEANVKCIVAMQSELKGTQTGLAIATVNDL